MTNWQWDGLPNSCAVWLWLRSSLDINTSCRNVLWNLPTEVCLLNNNICISSSRTDHESSSSWLVFTESTWSKTSFFWICNIFRNCYLMAMLHAVSSTVVDYMGSLFWKNYVDYLIFIMLFFSKERKIRHLIPSFWCSPS